MHVFIIINIIIILLLIHIILVFYYYGMNCSIIPFTIIIAAMAIAITNIVLVKDATIMSWNKTMKR